MRQDLIAMIWVEVRPSLDGRPVRGGQSGWG